MILSEVLSLGFDLNSFIVGNVLRGWIVHGDIAAVWMTEPLTSSIAACLLKTCHQAHVVGFYAELNSDTNRQSLEHRANINFVFQQVPVDTCAFSLPFRRRFTLFSVNVPVHLKLARRCDNFGNVYSKVVSSIELTEFDARYLLLVHLFTRSMPRTVGQTSSAGWAESRPGAQMGGTWDAVRGQSIRALDCSVSNVNVLLLIVSLLWSPPLDLSQCQKHMRSLIFFS